MLVLHLSIQRELQAVQKHIIAITPNRQFNYHFFYNCQGIIFI